MPEPSTATVPARANGKPYFNTRVATGKARHVTRVNSRSAWGRRDRELWLAIMSDLGGQDRLSTMELQIARRAVGLAIQCEQIEAQLAAGGEADTAALVSLVNAFNRCATILGLKRCARDVTPSLEQYLEQRYGNEAAE
jgi:hypothetical protein